MPSLAWSTTQVEGHTAYLNLITHQVVWKAPDNLCWRLIAGPSCGAPFWFNFRTHATAFTQPAELFGDAAEEAVQLSAHFWVNTITGAHFTAITRLCCYFVQSTGALMAARGRAGEATFDEPHSTVWRRLTQEQTQFHFYYHTETGERSWHPPDELNWRETLSKEHEKHYWFHLKTGEVSWTPPEHLAWVKHSTASRLPVEL